MRENNPVCLPGIFQQCELLNVLGQFQVENYDILIVGLENDVKNGPLDSLPNQPSQSYTELGRFKVQGQLCAILQVVDTDTSDQETAKKLSLATLLTERELQIATLVASGQSNKQIANQLCISEWTVSTHLRRIFMKLSVDSRAAMVYRCASLIQNCLEI